MSAEAVGMVVFVGSRDHTVGAEITGGLGSGRAFILSVLMICKDGGRTQGQFMCRNCVVCLEISLLLTPGSSTSFLLM